MKIYIRNILKYLVSSAAVVVWMIILNNAAPTDNEKSNLYTLVAFTVLFLWIGFGVYTIVSRNKIHNLLFLIVPIISCVILYFYYPWYDGYTGVEIIKDYSKKKENIKDIDIRWNYSLPLHIQNMPLIDMAQRKFVKEINPEKCYFFESYYYDSSGVPQFSSRYIIYLKSNVPYTTNPSVSFKQSNIGEYKIVNQIAGEDSAGIIVRNNVAQLYISKSGEIPLQANENYYESIGKYRITLQRTDPYNGFKVSNYWIYRLF